VALTTLQDAQTTGDSLVVPVAPSLRSAPALEVYGQDSDYAVAVAGKYLIQIVTKRATSMTVSLVRRGLSDLADRHDSFGFVAVIEPSAQLLMPPEIRAGYNLMVKRYSPRFTGAAIVFEKTGFHATAVRSIVTAINVASRATHPNHVFSSLQEGVYWVNRLTPGELSAAGLLKLITQLRAR
jgi:hypothetical protein